MLTLKEARKIQQNNQQKIIIKFVVSLLIIAFGLYLMVNYTNILKHGTFYYIFPAVAIPLAFISTGMHKFLEKNEFCGKVIKIHIYNLDWTRIRMGSDGKRIAFKTHTYSNKIEGEIIVQNEKGKTMLKNVRNRDLLLKISEGDSVTLLRTIEDPILSK